MVALCEQRTTIIICARFCLSQTTFSAASGSIFSKLQRRSLIHENGSDNPFQRYFYGHSKFSKMAGGRLLDLVQPEVDPFDPLSPKTIH